MVYDVSDMKPEIMAFANNSSNQAPTVPEGRRQDECDFKSEMSSEEVDEKFEEIVAREERQLVFFDCEVYPNLFVVCWKYHGDGHQCRPDDQPQAGRQSRRSRPQLQAGRLQQPQLRQPHPLGRMLGMNNEQLYKLSQTDHRREGRQRQVR
jgi:hypothetical protein